MILTVLHLTQKCRAAFSNEYKGNNVLRNTR